MENTNEFILSRIEMTQRQWIKRVTGLTSKTFLTANDKILTATWYTQRHLHCIPFLYTCIHLQNVLVNKKPHKTPTLPCLLWALFQPKQICRK